MKKDGFTIVELIAVITVLALIIVFVVPTFTGSSNSAKQKTYETKVETIEMAAILYGQDNYRVIVNNAEDRKTNYAQVTEDGISYSTYTMEVGDLVEEEYLTPDREDGSENEKVTDPRQSNKFLDSCTVKIKINTNTRKVTAEFDKACNE